MQDKFIMKLNIGGRRTQELQSIMVYGIRWEYPAVELILSEKFTSLGNKHGNRCMNFYSEFITRI